MAGSRTRSTRTSGSPRRPRNGYSEFYSYTSEAYDVLHDRHERYYKPRPVQRKNIVKRKRISSNKPKYMIDMSNRSKVAFMPYVALFVFFAGLIAVVFCGVKIVEMRMEINSLSRRHQEILDTNMLKSAQLAKSIDLKEVEHVATTRLGMVKPAQHQIVRVSVPRQNYVVQSLAPEENNEGIFAKISTFSKRVFAMAALW